MKYLFTLSIAVSCFLCSMASAQTTPGIQWQKMIGGSSNDYLYSVIQTADGGSLIGGYSGSTISGDKTEANQGGFDYWVLKLGISGNIEWQNTIGGSSGDQLYTVIKTADDGYLLGGYSNSNISGDKSEVSQGNSDYWVVKLGASGNIEWQNTIGGNSVDYLNAVIETTGGGYLLGGYSESGISGDKTAAGIGDFWVVQLNASGSIVSQYTIGGNSGDQLISIVQTTDGGFLFGGYSSSGISGNKTEASKGSYDYWVVKADVSGNIEWDKTIGGSDKDYLRFALQSDDGGYLLGGYTLSGLSGNKTEASQGGWDYYVVKLNSAGGIEWQNTIGGLNDDFLFSGIEVIGGGYLLGGYSISSVSGDKTAPKKGEEDEWILKLDGSGNIIWQQTFGGDGTEYLYSIAQSADGGFLLGGTSASPISDDVTEGATGYDYWVVKLAPEECMGFSAFADVDEDTYGNPAASIFITNCILPDGYVVDNTDCNDANAAINPGAAEVVNSVDDNCNGLIDEKTLCEPPATLPESNITASSAQLNWLPFSNALSYKLRYKVKNTDTWTNLTSSSNSKTLTGLLANTKYVWQVKSKCTVNPSIFSAWSEKDQFTTHALKITGKDQLQLSLEIYPNPSSGNTTIHFNLTQSSDIAIKIFDVNGKEIWDIVNASLEAGDHSLPINTSQFSKGNYFVQLISNTTIQIEKLIVQ